ncbi:XkdQ/YqbQ family protein [Dielma fastidiosa]|uniref:XkdQ/YqbQ family protein n=1 Tax=Dielma fastidiosa TaxID=1034346 RepID=UPI000E50DAD5|nr:hydrolase [Dielma fastidiosa]RHM98306.1 hydrolase [Dielma fastidiosa]
MDVNIELLIQHGDKVFIPVVQEGITWATERKGCPGELKFKVVKDDVISFTEGDAVRLKVNGQNVFYGFIFKKQRDKEQIISVTAYDQLRYLKNKDTIVYENKTAGELIQMIAKDYMMQTGTIEDTGFKIKSRVEENTSLFDMIQNALDMTLENQKYMYVMYDDFGKIALKGLDNMRLNLLIDEETGENFDYTSSIDSNTYNKVKLTYDNDKTGTREVYIAQDSENMNAWGVLQYFDTLQEGENGKAKADALLSLYNKKTRNLTIKNAFGDVRVRAGSMIVVMMDLGDMKLKNLMLVEKCKHEFKESQHLMTLTLRGGEFVA